MSTAIVQNHFDPEQVALIKSTIMSGKNVPSDADLALFGMICKRSGLDPFAKQIFAIERKGKWTFQVSVDGLRAIADRTGLYAGSDEPLFDEGLSLYQFEKSGRGVPSVCKVTVWKIVQGIRCAFTGVALYNEFVQRFDGKPSGLWSSMPANMLAKCAESQALRKAFPQCGAIEAQVQQEPPEDDSWRIKGYNWAVQKGVDPNLANEIVSVASSKENLSQRLQEAAKQAIAQRNQVIEAETVGG